MLKGERFYAFGDGLIDTENPHGERYGLKRLESCFKNQSDPEQWFETILADLNRFRQQQPARDDTTLIEVQCAQPFSQSTVTPSRHCAQKLQPLQWSVELELTPSVLRETQPVPHLVHALIDMQGLQAHRERLYTVLSELYSNALEHGLLRLDSHMKVTPEGFHEYYRLREERLSRLDAGTLSIGIDHRPQDDGGRIELVVEDTGDGFDLHQVELEMGRNDGYFGYGIPLVRSLCRSLRYPGKGNRAEVCYEWS